MTQRADEDFVTTIVTLEVQMRGWLAEIHRLREPQRQVVAYEELGRLFEFYGDWTVLPFDRPAAAEFQQLRSQRVRIGTMDLKIAAIVRTRDAHLLSANLRDFRQVPGLHVESWLD